MDFFFSRKQTSEKSIFRDEMRCPGVPCLFKDPDQGEIMRWSLTLLGLSCCCHGFDTGLWWRFLGTGTVARLLCFSTFLIQTFNFPLGGPCSKQLCVITRAPLSMLGLLDVSKPEPQIYALPPRPPQLPPTIQLAPGTSGVVSQHLSRSSAINSASPRGTKVNVFE